MSSEISFPYPIYGDTITVHSSHGISLSETVYPPRLIIPIHTHNEHGYFNLVLRGGYFERTRNQTQECGPLAMSFHSPGAAHANQFYDQESRLFNIRLDPSLLNQIQALTKVLEGPGYFQRGLLAYLAAKLYEEFRSADTISDLAIEELVLDMVSEAMNCDGDVSTRMAPPWLKRVRDILHCHFNERLSLAEIAADVGVHKVHIGRAFRRQFNCTIGEYMRFLRVELACRQLSMSQASLLDITLECGFSDQAHFTRTLKRFTGLTPLQYRTVFQPH